jgi:hypothetical protein
MEWIIFILGVLAGIVIVVGLVILVVAAFLTAFWSSF